jgi:hypothetical protein
MWALNRSQNGSQYRSQPVSMDWEHKGQGETRRHGFLRIESNNRVMYDEAIHIYRLEEK